MTRFKSVLCASLLTLAVSSSVFAGDISGRKGDISGKTNISSAPSSRSGDISGISTSISSPVGTPAADQSELVSDLLRTMFGVMGMLF